MEKRVVVDWSVEDIVMKEEMLEEGVIGLRAGVGALWQNKEWNPIFN